MVAGTGLGLTIGRELVRLMGGELYVKSTVGKGSTFWFDIPLPEALEGKAATPLEKQYIVGYEGERRKILVVDDRWENRLILVNLLVPLGFDVLEATDGRDALQKASEFEPDLIFTDLVMPGLDGFEVTHQIRNSAKLRHIKVIAVSASLSLSPQEITSETGLDGFMLKPVQLSEVFKALETHLDLEWVYKTREESVLPDRDEQQQRDNVFVAPPLSELSILYKFAHGGDIRRIRAQLDHIEQLDQRYDPFVREVRQLAKRFQIRQIRELVQHYLEQYPGNDV